MSGEALVPQFAPSTQKTGRTVNGSLSQGRRIVVTGTYYALEMRNFKTCVSDWFES